MRRALLAGLFVVGTVGHVAAQPVLLIDCDRPDWRSMPALLDVPGAPSVRATDLRLACEGLPAAMGAAACSGGTCCPLGPQAEGVVGGQVARVLGSSAADDLRTQLGDGVILRVTTAAVEQDPLCLGRGPNQVPPPPPRPNTDICAGPLSPSNNPEPEFSFRDPTGIAESFECSRDGGPWTSCTSPVGWGQPLGAGPQFHRFEVRGVTPAAGPDRTPARWRWMHVGDLLFGGLFEPIPTCDRDRRLLEVP
jgi:hypothetical protein